VLTEYSEEEFRGAVERKLKHKVPDAMWMILVDTLDGGPYGRWEVLEAVFQIRKYGSEFERRPERRGKKDKEREKIIKLELLSRRLYWWEQDPRARRWSFRAKKCREILGLSEPIPLTDIEDVLISFGAKKTVLPRKVFYPRQPVYRQYVDVGVLYYDPWRAELLSKVCDWANCLVNGLNWHPAEAIAFLLCDTVPPRREIPACRFYRQGGEITIKVAPNAKPEALARLYSQVRNEVIKDIRGIKGKRARPRALSLRVRTLLGFCRASPTLRGEELRRAWKEKYPSWEYGTVHSLSAVLSRAKKRIRLY